MQNDGYTSTNIDNQWSHWNAASFWLVINIGAFVWIFLGDGEYFAHLSAFVSCSWFWYDLREVLLLQRALRKYRESIAKTQDVLSKATIG